MSEPEVRTELTATASLRWAEGDRPRFKAWHGAKREAEWFYLVAEAALPIVEDDVRLNGRGFHVLADGRVGNSSANLRYARLGDVPEPWRAQIVDALRLAADGR